MPDQIIRQMRQEQAYGSIFSSQYADAQKASRANEAARRLGMDPDIVEHVLPDALAEERVRKRNEEIQRNEAYARIMAGNARLARAAIDDDHLPEVAKRVDDHISSLGYGPWADVRKANRTIGAGLANFVGGLVGTTSRGLAGLGQAFNENVGIMPILSSSTALTPAAIGLSLFGRYGQGPTKKLDEATTVRTGNRNVDDILMGARSAGSSVAALGITAATRNPWLGASSLGIVTGGLSYEQGREAGLDPQTAALYGMADAAVETGTEVIGQKIFAPVLQRGGRGALRALGLDIAAEVPGELAATTLQNFNRWAFIEQRQGKPFSQFVSELPDDLRSTFVATVATAGALSGTTAAIGRIIEQRRDVEAATGVDRIMEAAAQSTTRTSNPSDFREALNQLVGESDGANLYVPVERVREALGDKPVADDPFWSRYEAQIEEAAALGGDVIVPLSEAATELAGTPSWEAIRDHVRASPSGVSIAEAKAQRTPEELQRLAEEASTLITDTVRKSQLAAAREVVGRWSEQLGYSGERANVVNRLLTSALATRYNAAVGRAIQLGERPPTIEEFGAAWLPQAQRMTQQQYEAQGRPDALEQETEREQEAGTRGLGSIAAPARTVLERGGLRGVPGAVATGPGQVLGIDQPITGAPSAVTVPGRGRVAVQPFAPARRAAAAYMERAGNPYRPATTYAKVDVARAKRIAAAFEEMRHQPNNPVVAQAYDAMISETLEQYQLIKETGLQIEFIEGDMVDPYAVSPRLAILDVVENNHLWVFPTTGGFGQGEVDNSPMLRPTNEYINGRQLLANDVFRIVHDYFGHIKEGHGFRAEGEENAWQSHAAMYSPLARRAMTTETRGQNSWLNYGPYAESNRTASAADTVYAPQKVGLLPQWASDEGMLSGQELDQLVDQQSLNATEREDVAAFVTEQMGEDFSLGEVQGMLFANGGYGIKIPGVALDPNEIDASNWGLSEAAVGEYAGRASSAPRVLVERADGGWKLVEGGHRLAAAKRRGDVAIRALDVSSLRGDWPAWFDGDDSAVPVTLNQDVITELTRPPVDVNGDITLQHYSPLDNLTHSDPTMWGSRGTHFFSRSERQYMSSAPPRTYFGIASGEPGGYRIEFVGRTEYRAKIPKERLYDVGKDPDKLWVRGQPAEGETAIRDAGYAGYWHKNPELGLVAVVFEPVALERVETDTAQTFNQLVHIPGFSHIEPYLTPEERENLRAQSKEKILDIARKLPDAAEMAAVAVAGRAKKGWYASSAQAIVDVFGIKDAPRFAALLAALSPQTSVEMNLYNALRVWTVWDRNGRPTDRQQIVQLMGEGVAGKKGSGSILGAWINNSVTALTAQDPGKIVLSGPKVNSFMNNLVGVTEEVTNDTWMANYADIQQEMFRRDNKGGKGPGYKAFNAVVRRTAEIATERTGEDWTPSEIQETVWSFARTLYLRRDQAGEDRDMQTLLEAGQVTHSDIAATPDFAVLFQDGIFRTILSEAGYAPEALQGRGRAVGLDERASVAESEGTGFAPDAFRYYLAQAAARLERVRQRRRADRPSNEDQPELVFNQAVNPQEEIFYSAAQRVVSESKQEKASAQQWIALLTPGRTPGIKSEEIEWTGVIDWLKMQQGQIEKGALLQFLRDRGVQVDEHVLGENPNEDDNVAPGYEVVNRGTGFELLNPNGDPVSDYYRTEREAIRASHEDASMGEYEPQFQTWSSDPNNPTYRELLITLPLGQGSNPTRAPSTHFDTEGVVAHVRFMDKTDAEGKRVLFIEEIQSDWHQKGRDQGYEQPVSVEQKAKIAEAEKVHREIEKELEEVEAKLRKHEQKLNDLIEPSLRRAYEIDVANVEEIAKTNDKVTPSAIEAFKTTMRNQYLLGFFDSREGSYIGYNDLRNAIGLAQQTFEKRGEKFPKEVDAALDEQTAMMKERSRLSNEANLAERELHIAREGVKRGIPEAPFKSSWPALVMKRMIRWAVDHGAEKIAWTTGEEQAERYNLSTAVGSITITPERQEVSKIVTNKVGDRVRTTERSGDLVPNSYLVNVGNADAMQTIRRQYNLTYASGNAMPAGWLRLSSEQLKELFGADLSKRLIEGASQHDEAYQRLPEAERTNTAAGFVASGEDLRVGGEGMKAFYDRNLVNITNDIIKKYGAKVGRVEVETIKNRHIKAAARSLAELGPNHTQSPRLQEVAAQIPDTNPGFEITPQLAEAASGGFPLFQQRRGNISIIPGPDGLMRSALIRSFEASNFSTAIHELGHFFLEDLRRRALSTGATDQERADWTTFKDWALDLGHLVADDVPIPNEAHEYFARGFERFTWEGATPSIGLRRLFFRLREFMMDLYKSAMRFDAPITPEIREVMGRMLASDEEVNEQRERMQLVSGQVEKLMTEDEHRAYTDLAEESRQDARDALFTRILSQLRQEKLTEARDRKAQIRQEVQAEVDNQPLFRALKMLRVGMPQPDGSFTKVKLSRQQLIEVYGDDIESRLPVTVPPIIANQSTLDIDQIAALTGFDSGDEMIKALEAHASVQSEQRAGGDRRSVRARMVDEMTDDRYREEVGDPLENLEEEAQAALASDRQADLLSMELRAMGRRTGQRVTPWKMAKEWAEKRVRLQTSQDAVSGRAIQMYARNAAKAAQQAEEALVKGNVDDAFTAKQRQMLNMALLAEAKRAKEQVKTAQARLKRIASRETIPSIDQDYLEQAHQLLEDVDLKTKSQAEVERRKAFEDWYLEQVAEGKEPVVPARYRTALGQTHWSRLSIEEFLELDRAIGQIVELGRLKQQIRDGQRQRNFDEGISEMVGQAELKRRITKGKTTDAQRTLGGRIRSRLRGVDAAMIKMEQMVEWLDKGQKNGPWRRLIFNVMSEAQAKEKDLTDSYVTRLNKIIKALPKTQLKGLDRLVDTPELVIRNPGHSMNGEAFKGTKDQILMMAMNWGNAGNRQRLLDGFGWQEHDVLQVFDRLMTKEDWDLVQGVWDLVDELWPEIEQLERRVNGIAPERVEATQVPTKHGVYRGGYFPVVFDPNESTQAERDEASKLSPGGAWHQVSTRAGSTRTRVERVMGRPLLLNMGVITRHIGEVIHDVTHREAVVQVRKILNDNRIRAVVNSRLGPEYHRRMGAWLENIATPNVANAKSDPTAIAVARHLNKGVSLVGLGFRITTILVQPLGLANSMSELGSLRVLGGLRTVVANPLKTYNEIVQRSGEMRSRFSTMDASIEDMMNEAKSDKLKVVGPKALVKYAFHGILYMDALVSMSSWIGAYNKALEEGGSEDEAVAYADSVIRKTQGAGGQKDRSAILSENQFARTFWPFFSYLNALYNQQRDVFHRGIRANSVGEVADALRRGWWVFIVPTLLQAMIFGNGPDGDDDDPESWAEYLIKSILLGNLASLPGVGALSSAIGAGYGYRSNAWQGIGEDLKKSWEDIDKLYDGDSDLKGSTVQKVITTAGIITAKPLGQAAATSRGVYDYAVGEADPQSAGDWYNLLTKGRIPKQPTAIQQLAGAGQEEQ